MRRRVAEVAHFFGIEPWFRASVADLSGGQQQMVNLAAVLALQPRLLVLDEPTAQLDPVAEKNFLHALFRVNRELGITVVMATHAPEATAPYATDLVELANGQVRPVAVPCATADAPAPGPASAFGPASAIPSPRVEGASGGSENPLLDVEAAPRPIREVSSARPIREVSPAATREAPPVLSFRDAHFRYSREAGWVVRGLDLDVRMGDVHAVVGGNGCGKSTLLRLAAGVLRPERGRVENRLAARRALLPQNPEGAVRVRYGGRGAARVASGCGYGDDAIDAALGASAAHAARHPYDLSGGQQQLLAFAKILLTDPDLLLLDEPTKGSTRPRNAAGRPHPVRSAPGRGDRRPRDARPGVRRPRGRPRHHAVRRRGRLHGTCRGVLRGQPVLPPDRGCVLPHLARRGGGSRGPTTARTAEQRSLTPRPPCLFGRRAQSEGEPLPAAGAGASLDPQ